MTTWLTDEEQAAWRAWLAATRLVAEALEAQLQRDAGMPHAYYEVLVRLSEAPDGALRMSELARAVGSSRSRLSHAVARLEARGWVAREACAQDLRGTTAFLTDAGRAALQQAAPGHVAAVRAVLLDALSPAQVQQLRRVGEAVVRHATSTPTATGPAPGRRA